MMSCVYIWIFRMHAFAVCHEKKNETIIKMENLTKTERIEKITKRLTSGREMPLIFFREWMVKEIQLWEDFDYKNWLFILDQIKNEPLNLYSFFPFIYRILGIEIMHEFESLKNVDKEVLRYVNKGKGFHIHSLRGSDLTFYKKNKAAINKAYEIRNKLILQGAKPNNKYTLCFGEEIGNWKKYRLYRRKIKREDFTTVSIEDSKQDKFLFEERDLEQYRKK